MYAQKTLSAQGILRPFAVVLLVFPLSCKESLPPLVTPPPALQSEISVLAYGPYVTIHNGAPTGMSGAFQISVTNIYDEVLQDSAEIEGDLHVWLKDDPSKGAIVISDAGDLLTWEMAQGGMMTIEPNSTAILARQWPHRTQDSIPFWDYVKLYPSATTSGVPFCKSDTVHFVVQGTIRLFRHAPVMPLGPLEFSVVYQVFDINC